MGVTYVPRRGDQLENEAWQSPGRQEWVSVITIVIMSYRDCDDLTRVYCGVFLLSMRSG